MNDAKMAIGGGQGEGSMAVKGLMVGICAGRQQELDARLIAFCGKDGERAATGLVRQVSAQGQQFGAAGLR